MSNLAIDAALKASNFLNLISIHSKNVFDNIIRNSDLNGAIVAGSQNVWNIFDSNGWALVMVQNNTIDKYGQYRYYRDWGDDSWGLHYVNKSDLSNYGVRVLIKYRE